MPMMIRDGMVRATFNIRMVFISGWLRCNDLAIANINGAWLNQTTKLIKKANQVIWRILMFPEKEKRLSLDIRKSNNF